MHRKSAFMILISLFIIAACQSQSDEIPTSTFPPTQPPLENTATPPQSLDPLQIDWDDMWIYASGLTEEAQSALIDLLNPTQYHLDWLVAPDLGSISASARILYTNNETLPLEVLYLRLYPNLFGGRMEFHSFSINGNEIQGSLEAASSLYRIDLPQALDPGSKVELSIEYALSLPREMSGNYGLFGSFDGFLLLQEAYPIIPVFNEEGWDTDLPPEHGDVIHMDTSFYIVRVTLPSYLDVIASGFELDRATQGEWQSITFAAGPARDFYLAATEHLEPVIASVGDLTIRSYTLPEMRKSAEATLSTVEEAVRIFGQLLGNYPYIEFDLISTPMQALGMEYPGVVAQNIRMYDPEATVSNLPAPILLESVTVHEVAHQWFYNWVGNDQVQAPWMDEALVQYITAIYYRDRYGTEAYKSLRQSWYDRWDQIDQQPTPIGLPAAAYDPEAYTPLVYGRGPLFVEAVANRMGESVFWTFMRTYVENNAWSIAQPREFTELAEEICDCELDDIWDGWGVFPE